MTLLCRAIKSKTQKTWVSFGVAQGGLVSTMGHDAGLRELDRSDHRSAAFHGESSIPRKHRGAPLLEFGGRNNEQKVLKFSQAGNPRDPHRTHCQWLMAPLQENFCNTCMGYQASCLLCCAVSWFIFLGT